MPDYNYNADLFDPPAPLSQVVLRNPLNADRLSGVLMLLDSGADVTLIPTAAATQLGVVASTDEVYELMGFDGSITLAPAVRLEMLFLNKSFKGRFLLVEQEWGIIGRDILNLITILLDGPKLSWSEQRHAG